MTTKKLCTIAVFTAITALFNIFTFSTGVKYFVITFTYIPCLISGAFLGPVAGFAVGFLGDLLGGIIHPLGVYNPYVAVASGLLGFIPGLIFKYIKVNDYLKIIISFFICLVICTAGLNTLGLFLMYSKGKTFWAYLGVRLPFQLAVLGINLAATLLLWKPLKVVERKVLLDVKK